MRELKGFYAGVNLGGWFSQCDYSLDTYNNFIKEEDFAKIASWGFDHVRIPVDYNLFINNKDHQDKDAYDENYYDEAGFVRVEDALGYCRKYGLNAVLDLHKTMGFSFDSGEHEHGFFESEELQRQFVDLWDKLSDRYLKYEDIAAFELLNEVTDREYMPIWNKIATEVIEMIRRKSKTVKISVGGFYNNSALAVSSIDVPLDENIIFNFHCYSPLLFTHQGAYWIDTMDTRFRMKYRNTYGQYIEKMRGVVDWTLNEMEGCDLDEMIGVKHFEDLWQDAIKTAEEKNVYLYCGEYGVIELADNEDILEWYKDIHAAFKKYGIGHALWSYKGMDFDFVGEKMNDIREEIIETSKNG